jgi:small subunit ribosomal protein S1
MVNKGDEIDVVVLDISQEKKRISLGMKQINENPWDMLAEEYAIDTIVEGTVTRLLDRGAVVELRPDVEGFVPVGQLGKPDLGHPEGCFDVNDKLPLKVIKIDPKNKRIVLSVSAYMRGADDDEVKSFHEKFPIRERPAEQEKPATEDNAAPPDSTEAASAWETSREEVSVEEASVEEAPSRDGGAEGDASAVAADAPEEDSDAEAKEEKPEPEKPEEK